MSRGSCGASRHPLRRVFDRADDIVVTGAAAKVAFELMPDARTIGRLSAADHIDSGHNHARGAEAALKAMIVAKSLLNRMQLAILGKPFNRRDFGTLRLH